MSELILYHGNDPITVKPSAEQCYLYRVGAGRVEGGEFIDLNDATRLNTIAETIRDSYSAWIYSLNEIFVDSRLILDDLSLFFLTDLSCKRSEFFETFDLICNLILLRERLSSVQLGAARLIGVDDAFISAFESTFPNVPITIGRHKKEIASVGRRIVADTLFLGRTIGVLVMNRLTTRRLKKVPGSKRIFFSFYPQMFEGRTRETKYGTLVDDVAELAVMVLADGMHQEVSLGEYFTYSREAECKGMQVIDRYLRFRDIYLGLVWAVRLWWWYASQRGSGRHFEGIDVSGFVRGELRFSISRITRLCILKGAIARFLRQCQPDEVYYYPVEYPLGRLISWVTELVGSNIERTGFQMGIVSQRRLEQFMAPGEASNKSPYIHHAPIPDRVKAEDTMAASIYRSAGYQGVALMNKVYRYEYLEKIEPQRRPGWCLIAPGLHDGAMMLEQLRDKIRQQPETTWVVKPHPRADNQYLQQWSTGSEVQVAERSVADLLAIVSEVFVTYSSVGLEARQLGLKVTVINVPGRVNASPLLDHVG